MSNKKLVEKAFKIIKLNFDPKLNLGSLNNLLFNMPNSNFSGGNGDVRTMHERIFHVFYPEFIQQVSFGSGKGGFDKYGFKTITVDFLDEKNNIAYEIDGKNHEQELQKLKDRMKEIFLYQEYGIKTKRITNQNVEEMLLKRLEKLEEEGVLDAYFNQ